MENEEEVEFEESDEEGEVSQRDLINRLREKLKEAESKATEYLSGWQKERAESVNLKKRLEELQ